MKSSPARTACLLSAIIFAASACASGSGTAASPSAKASVTTIEQTGSAASAAAPPTCGPADAAPVEHPDWTASAGAATEIIPIVASSLLSVGPSRFLYTVTDSEFQVLAAPDVATRVSFYALDRDATTPVATAEGTFLDTQTGRGLYRAAVDFDCAGEWGVEVSADLPDGTTATERVRFRVHPVGTTPAIGDPAPRSDTPTASSIDEVRLVSTDPDPYPGAYERTVGEVVTAGQPSLVFFATPAFCQTGLCGPTMELVKSVALDYRDRIGFVNVEPYVLQVTENGLQPMLDADGNLQPVQAVLDYGIQVEPYLFVVDAAGDVFAQFEGVVGDDELRVAIEEVLADAA